MLSLLPRRTAQHTGRAGWAVLVLAPFPHIAAHIVEAKLVRRKATYWRGVVKLVHVQSQS